LAGSGRGAKALDEKINSGGFAPRHARYKWAADVRPYYAAMDILAMPSVESETFGRVSIEAQASGVPVLCSDIGGIPETVSAGKTGLLLQPGNVVAWRDAIVALANDSERRNRMAKEGRDWVVQKFSAQVIGQQFEKMLADN
jgi:glycosyltransferase involved in cell wall biosynthesis